MGLLKKIKESLPERKTKTGIIQGMIITSQAFGKLDTYCKKCREKIGFKQIRADGSYTRLCNCGCRLYQYHAPDEFHKKAFFIEKFIPKKNYDYKYKEKDELEKQGLTKKEFKHKTLYTLEGTKMQKKMFEAEKTGELTGKKYKVMIGERKYQEYKDLGWTITAIN